MDFIALGGFTFSLYEAIHNVKNTRVHGRWMIASVLWSLQPALIRLLNNPISIITNGNPPINFTEVKDHIFKLQYYMHRYDSDVFIVHLYVRGFMVGEFVTSLIKKLAGMVFV